MAHASTITITSTIEHCILERILPNFDIKSTDEGWLRKQVQLAIGLAVKKGLVSDSTPRDLTETASRVNFSLGPAIAEPVVAACKASGAVPGLVGYAHHCRGLLKALAALPAAEINPIVSWAETAGKLGELVQVLNQSRTIAYQERPEQALFYAQLRDAFATGSIALAEAPTGVGKSLAILAAGIETIVQHKTRLLITAPTLALLSQYAEAYKELIAADSTVPPLRVIFGRQEFISEHALAQFLEQVPEADGHAQALAWMQAGGPAQPNMALQTKWLKSSLQEAAFNFPADEVKLSSIAFPADLGNQAYRGQFQDNRDQVPEIMLCSHAMCAIDQQRRMWLSSTDLDYKSMQTLKHGVLVAGKGKVGTAHKEIQADVQAMDAEMGFMLAELTEKTGMLPSYQVLVIDEAHQFEANASMALSNDISMREVVRMLNVFKKAGGRVGLPRIVAVAGAVQVLMAGGKFVDEMVLLQTTDPALQPLKSALHVIYTNISGLKEPASLTGEGIRALILLRRAAAGLKLTLEGGYAYLKYSPVRAYPQLLVGKKSVENVLTLMWNATEAGAAVSATLYLNTAGGGVSGEHHRRLLAIPESRLKFYDPVAIPWLIRPVKEVWTVPAQNGWLEPPKSSKKANESSYDTDESRWVSEIAQTLVTRIIPSAAGGILVLLTSHTTRTKLETWLFDAGYSARLVNASAGIPLQRQREVFLRMAQAGLKPIWLGVGGAGTGLDVGGHDPYARLFGESVPAADDNVLTDLVIPRIPFKMNRSITHGYRMANRPNWPWEVFETAFLFRQWLGRLIRREGLPANRRIWMLDPRLTNPVGYTHIRTALGQYQGQRSLLKP